MYKIDDIVSRKNKIIFTGTYTEIKDLVEKIRGRIIDANAFDQYYSHNLVKDKELISLTNMNGVLVDVSDVHTINVFITEYGYISIKCSDILYESTINRLTLEDFKCGKFAIDFDIENDYELLLFLFKNNIHFIDKETDNTAVCASLLYKDLPYDETLPDFLKNMYNDIINLSCYIYKDGHIELGKRDCQDYIHVHLNDLGWLKKKFQINSIVHVKKEESSYTGMIIGFDDINNEYEVAAIGNCSHNSEWLSVDKIFECERIKSNEETD